MINISFAISCSAGLSDKHSINQNVIILGETDQETLRNITSAPLDFPSELFEGVSDEAKEFIKMCLNRNPL